MPIQDLCFRNVATIDQNSTLEEAAGRMKADKVGALIVSGKDRKPLGILTDRDIVVGAVAAGKLPSVTKVAEVMSKDVMHVAKEAGVAEVIDSMVKKGVRRAVVVEKDKTLCGLISADDLLQLLGDELSSLGKIAGRQSERKRATHAA